MVTTRSMSPWLRGKQFADLRQCGYVENRESDIRRQPAAGISRPSSD
jgi:hypothetical protein